jgi:hypothetical protein
MEVCGLHARAALPSQKKPGTHLIGGWVCPRAGLGVLEKTKLICLYGDLNPDFPARSLISIAKTLPWLPLQTETVINVVVYPVTLQCHLIL